MAGWGADTVGIDPDVKEVDGLDVVRAHPTFEAAPVKSIWGSGRDLSTCGSACGWLCVFALAFLSSLRH